MRNLAQLLITAVNTLYASLFGGPIDGTAWDVKLRKPGFFQWTSKRDTLIFQDGRATAAAAAQEGYSSALYEAADRDGGTAFRLVFDAQDRAPAEWSGRIEGRRISGVVIVRGQDGKSVRYVFTGKRKAA
ncbi:MAG: hypothetical protein HY552_01405 [Elusimicrobia bacterium]|nr:hypothetical protein [Elusimicrobiota bacterium]